jgi:hypothetical protein
MRIIIFLLSFISFSQSFAAMWRPANNNLPQNAYSIGYDTNGKALFACRAKWQNSLQVGKTWQGAQACHISYGGAEKLINNYQVLVNKSHHNWRWRIGRYADPIRVGFDTDHKALYLCKGSYLNSMQIGKTWSGYDKCNIAYGGKEILLDRFTVLSAAQKHPSNKPAKPHTAPTHRHSKHGNGYQCITNFTSEICGYNCLKSGTAAACAPRKGMQCMADNLNHIQCGYHCIASPFKVVCSQHKRDTCVKNAFNEIRCGRNCRVDNFNHIECD